MAARAHVPRLSEITRAGRKGVRTLVANIDYVWLCVTIDEAVRSRLVERLAAIGWDSGATPVFVITKTDLLSAESATLARRSVRDVSAGIDVFCTTTVTMGSGGIGELATLFAEPSTSALIGHSGVGKSALINAITGEDQQRLGRVRERDAKGRHTTTSRQLFEIPGTQSTLIDTPGLREFGLAVADGVIDDVFNEIDTLSNACRFNDCNHADEPGCAISAAVETGTIDRRRLESYQQLQRESAFNNAKALPARRDKDKEYTRMAREYRRTRGR
ncbi:ribosome small subunit-dependent GTPase A [Leifsonia sp. PS1209]|uniref:ribosome small subunit-dependent GTPase A n=1 Tax=Leifsonia sp. PS1209 TaxID=2724914 RepID=UPI001FF9F7E4|nr:ribosome small subunit-dependent GTPase A [Leifsonia sp. PS1209]